MLGKRLAAGTAAFLALFAWSETARAGDLFQLRLDKAPATPAAGVRGDAGALAQPLGTDIEADTIAAWHHHGWGGYRGFGYGGYRGFGYGGYRGFGYGGYRGFGFGGYRPWGYSYYRPWGYGYGYGSYYYPSLSFGFGYSPYYYSSSYYSPYYCWPSSGSPATMPYTTQLAIRPRALVQVPPQEETTPPPAQQPRDGTYNYDGGPANPVPMPKAESNPTRQPPAPVPYDGLIVSQPARKPAATKFAYPAYGDQKATSFAETRTIPVRERVAQRDGR